MRFLLNAQLLYFLFYGVAAGFAFDAVIEKKVKEAERRAYSVIFADPALLRRVSLATLSEIPI